MKVKRHPQRTCIACRKTKDKQTLVRIVRTPKQQIVVDPTGKTNGRGVYLCRKEQCWQKELHPNQLSKALRIPVSLNDVVQLQSDLTNLLS